jgi:phosphoribosylglycinamide formyltransferase-1
MVDKLRVGVLASGNGTDLQSIIDASENEIISAEVKAVISDNNTAFALKRAERHNIEAIFIDPENKTVTEHETEINRIITDNKVGLLVGAGYMRILSSFFIKRWHGKLINIHPALLPSFKGINGQGDALDYGVKISGCTTHFMDEKMDHGPIILQAAVRILQSDDRKKLADRILAVEHQILPRSVELFAQKRLKIEGRRVRILPGDSWLKKYKLIPGVLYPEGY